jgi:hypothetical protein
LEAMQAAVGQLDRASKGDLVQVAPMGQLKGAPWFAGSKDFRLAARMDDAKPDKGMAQNVALLCRNLEFWLDTYGEGHAMWAGVETKMGNDNNGVPTLFMTAQLARQDGTPLCVA